MKLSDIRKLNGTREVNPRAKALSDSMAKLHLGPSNMGAIEEYRWMPAGVARHLLGCQQCMIALAAVFGDRITKAMLERWSTMPEDIGPQDMRNWPHIIPDQVREDKRFLNETEMRHVGGCPDAVKCGCGYYGCPTCKAIVAEARPDALPCPSQEDLKQIAQWMATDGAVDADLGPEMLKESNRALIHALMCHQCHNTLHQMFEMLAEQNGGIQ